MRPAVVLRQHLVWDESEELDDVRDTKMLRLALDFSAEVIATDNAKTCFAFSCDSYKRTEEGSLVLDFGQVRNVKEMHRP